MGIKKTLVACLLLTPLSVNAITITTDIISIVDESGSMSREHAWLAGMLSSLDSGLAQVAEADPLNVQYGLVGFGGNGSHLSGHAHDINPSATGLDHWGGVAELGVATQGLLLDGETEDGYSGIMTALNYPGQFGATRNLILVTDEDRDDLGEGETFNSISQQLLSTNTLLNAVLNINIRCSSGQAALGLDKDGNGYIADGRGGFSICGSANIDSGAGSSIIDYAEIALDTGGAAWDLNKLRVGGLTAESFTNAFVEIKIFETIENSKTPSQKTVALVPEPESLFLFVLGLLGLRLRKMAV